MSLLIAKRDIQLHEDLQYVGSSYPEGDSDGEAVR
jgi:hypothetical protein